MENPIIQSEKVQSEKKEWITPVLIEESVESETLHGHLGPGGDGVSPTFMAS